jgi:hypothetical protein
MISVAIKNAFKKAEQRNWDKTYWAIDIHETMIRPNWSAANIPTDFYPKAKETLQYISSRKDIVIILYTCSHPHEVEQYLVFFKENGIRIDYVNSNPEVANGNYGYYDNKPYFNVLLEDKAGFDPDYDWDEVYNTLLTQAEISRK